jgi:hypothetical protein
MWRREISILNESGAQYEERRKWRHRRNGVSMKECGGGGESGIGVSFSVALNGGSQWRKYQLAA